MDVSRHCIQCHHQVNLGALDTTHTKIHFEHDAFLAGVHISKCHIDNGVFKSCTFLEELAKKKQDISFLAKSWDLVHHIKMALLNSALALFKTYMANTMMIHVATQQP